MTRPIPLAAIALIVTCWTSANAAEHTPYLPLAKITLMVSAKETDNFKATVAAFAARENLTIETGDLPKQGRVVLNEVLRFRTDTFFHATNFQNAIEVEIVAYSHEPESAWRPVWDRLSRSLLAKFTTAPSSQH